MYIDFYSLFHCKSKSIICQRKIKFHLKNVGHSAYKLLSFRVLEFVFLRWACCSSKLKQSQEMNRHSPGDVCLPSVYKYQDLLKKLKVAEDTTLIGLVE